MAIAFNLPSEREASEENFSRLNRLLAELYEVLCHILVTRQPGQEAHETRRERPFSESDVERPAPQAPPQCRISASSPPLNMNLEAELDDDVFVSPRGDNGNDPFSTRNLEIFGVGTPRTPAGVLLSPRRDRTFTFSVTSEKHWQDKGGTNENAGEEGETAAEAPAEEDDTDVIDAAASSEHSAEATVAAPSDGSIFSSIIPDKVSGSICTAILLMLGWKLLSHKQ